MKNLLSVELVFNVQSVNVKKLKPLRLKIMLLQKFRKLRLKEMQ